MVTGWWKVVSFEPLVFKRYTELFIAAITLPSGCSSTRSRPVLTGETTVEESKLESSAPLLFSLITAIRLAKVPVPMRKLPEIKTSPSG